MAAKPDEWHPWAERSQRFPGDIRLRAHGFTIHARPKKGTALWRRAGEVYTDRDAHEAVTREVQAAGATYRRGKRK